MEAFKTLLPEFCVLTISVCLFLGVILYNRLHRGPLCIFFFLIFTELYTPAYYYVMTSTESYVHFGVETLRTYIWMSTAAFLVYSMILAVFQRVDFRPSRLAVTRWGIPAPAAKSFLLLLVVGITALLVLYLAYYREGLPLYQAIFHSTWLDRPDTTGGVPHWFTISAFLCVAFPCFYLYYHQRCSFSWFTNLLLIGAVSLFMVVGGNKGFVVYWFLFLWVYLWGMKLDMRILIVGGISVIVLLIIMTGTTDVFSLSGFLSGLEYGIGRFFLTQGAMLVNRIEMIRQGFVFDLSSITAQVYTFVYEQDGGSSPTYYLGDLIVEFSLLRGFLLHLVVFTILAAISRWLACQPFSEYKTWLFFCIQYFLGINSICSSFLFRLALVIALLLMFMAFGEPESAGFSSDTVPRNVPRKPHSVRRLRRPVFEEAVKRSE